MCWCHGNFVKVYSSIHEILTLFIIDEWMAAREFGNFYNFLYGIHFLFFDVYSINHLLKLVFCFFVSQLVQTFSMWPFLINCLIFYLSSFCSVQFLFLFLFGKIFSVIRDRAPGGSKESCTFKQCLTYQALPVLLGNKKDIKQFEKRAFLEKKIDKSHVVKKILKWLWLSW